MYVLFLLTTLVAVYFILWQIANYEQMLESQFMGNYVFEYKNHYPVVSVYYWHVDCSVVGCVLFSNTCCCNDLRGRYCCYGVCAILALHYKHYWLECLEMWTINGLQRKSCIMFKINQLAYLTFPELTLHVPGNNCQLSIWNPKLIINMLIYHSLLILVNNWLINNMFVGPSEMTIAWSDRRLEITSIHTSLQPIRRLTLLCIAGYANMQCLT